MGQVHEAAAGGDDDGDGDGDADADADGEEDGGWRRIDVGADGEAWRIPTGAAADSAPSGSALNRVKQPVLQK
jgi:hypothetical protein